MIEIGAGSRQGAPAFDRMYRCAVQKAVFSSPEDAVPLLGLTFAACKATIALAAFLLAAGVLLYGWQLEENDYLIPDPALVVPI